MMSDTPKKSTDKKVTVDTTVRASGKQKESNKSASVKHKHAQLIRDSFTIPEDEYALLAETKMACLDAGFEIKKSELIRIGIALAYELSTSRLKKAQQALQPVKTGRPKKSK